MAVLQSNWRQGVPTTALREFVSRVPLAKRCIFVVVGGGFSHLSASLLSLPQVPWEPCDDAFSFSPSPDALSPLPPPFFTRAFVAAAAARHNTPPPPSSTSEYIRMHEAEEEEEEEVAFLCVFVCAPPQCTSTFYIYCSRSAPTRKRGGLWSFQPGPWNTFS